MTTLLEIKAAVNAVLKKEYPALPIYGADTEEGYQKPSFFVFAVLQTGRATRYAIEKTVDIEIDYIQKEPDEADAMRFFAAARKALHPKLTVGERFFTTDGFLLDFLGECQNIPHVEFSLTFWDDYAEETAQALMEEIVFSEKIKEEKEHGNAGHDSHF